MYMVIVALVDRLEPLKIDPAPLFYGQYAMATRNKLSRSTDLTNDNTKKTYILESCSLMFSEESDTLHQFTSSECTISIATNILVYSHI